VWNDCRIRPRLALSSGDALLAMHSRALRSLPDPLSLGSDRGRCRFFGSPPRRTFSTISLGTDLGLGQSMEHILRQTLVSLWMAKLLALDEAEREVAYFSGLLAWVGCHTDAYEQAKWFGDDIAVKRDGYHYDMGRPVDLLTFAWHTVGRGPPPLE
jgi:hypothetical protein